MPSSPNRHGELDLVIVDDPRCLEALLRIEPQRNLIVPVAGKRDSVGVTKRLCPNIFKDSIERFAAVPTSLLRK